ncbi:MAG: type II toxin-antitoxin system HicA family toxin [Bryobacteraceae bacterium]
MKVREVIRLLEKFGWVEMRSRGSHRHFKHPNEALVITVPGNEGKELAPCRDPGATHVRRLRGGRRVAGRFQHLAGSRGSHPGPREYPAARLGDYRPTELMPTR